MIKKNNDRYINYKKNRFNFLVNELQLSQMMRIDLFYVDFKAHKSVKYSFLQLSVRNSGNFLYNDRYKKWFRFL